MTPITAALNRRDREAKAVQAARALPPITDAQVARVAGLLSISIATEREAAS